MKAGIPLASRAQIKEDVVLSQALAGEMVLLNLATGAYFGLDPVGTRIWQLIQEHSHLQHVLALLLEEFDVEEECCRTDLLQLVSTLCSHGLLELTTTTEATPSL